MKIAVVRHVRLGYEERGDGESVIFIHLAPFAGSFAPLMDQPALAGYGLVRYHRRGYDRSSSASGRRSIGDQAADLAGLLAYLGIGRGHIVGHSYGGLVALQLALDRPDMVGSLVLMEPALRVRAGGSASQELTQRMAPAFQRFLDGDLAGATHVFLTAVFGPGYRQVTDNTLPNGWTQVMQDARTFFGVENPELRHWQFGETEAQRLMVSLLSLVGAESHPTFGEIEQLLATWFPQLETARVPGVNHMLHLRQPEPVAEVLATFLARHPLT